MATAAMARSSPVTRIQRTRIRRVVGRAGWRWGMPPFKAAPCCQHVCGFRYAGDTRPHGLPRGLRRAGKSDRDEQPPGRTGREVERPVVCPDDAVDDGQAEANTGMLVGARAFRAALEGLRERRHDLRRELTARVLDPEHARVLP